MTFRIIKIAIAIFVFLSVMTLIGHFIVLSNVKRSEEVLELINCNNYLLKTCGFTCEVHMTEPRDIDQLEVLKHKGVITYSSIEERYTGQVFKGLRKAK
jgi:hypothetical protein